MSQATYLSPRGSTRGRFLLLGLFLLALTGSAQAATLTVGCPSGGTFTGIQDAVNASSPGDVIVVSGTCTESVFIGDRAHLTIGATTLGSATVVALTDNDAFDLQGSRDINFVGLIINGGVGSVGGGGIVAVEDSTFIVRNSTIQNNVDVGVALDLNSRVTIIGSTLQGNGDGVRVRRNSLAVIRNCNITNNAFQGLSARDRSSLQFQRTNHIVNNGDTGVIVFGLSRADLGGGALDNTTVESNVNLGIFVGTQSVLGVGPNSKIRNNGNSCIAGITANFCGGIVGLRNSTLRIDTAEVSGNGSAGIAIEQGVGILIFNSTISNNSGDGVSILRISIGDFFAPNTFFGNGGASISCDDTSLVAGDVSAVPKENISCKRVESAHGPDTMREPQEEDKE